MNRRTFIKTAAKGIAGAALFSQIPAELFAEGAAESVFILHTNDTHSRLEPFPAGDKNYGGRGGVEARKGLVDSIRKSHAHTLLLDAGDIFQGTPYFNLYKGKPEIEAMNQIGYEACTIGNHDFDGGISGLKSAIERANFPFLIANYDFQNELNGKTLPHQIFKKGPATIGVFGLGIEPEGLIPSQLCAGTIYKNPIEVAKEQVKILNDKGCNLIICLSHLGYRYEDKKVSDVVLAKEVDGIDFIIGGHTHTFLDTPVEIKNNSGITRVCQAGWAGLALGQIEVVFSKEKFKIGRRSYRHSL